MASTARPATRIFQAVIHRSTTLRTTGSNLAITKRSSVLHRDEGTSDTPARAHNAPYSAPTHSCRTLNLDDVGSTVVLTGWLCPGRKAGKKFAFFPLRDVHGTTQLVVQAREHDCTMTSMLEVPSESTVLIEGLVNARPQSQRRLVPAGDIEVQVTSFTLLNRADSDLPFMPSDSRNLANEDLRLRYRYLDLRRPALSDNIRKRSQVAHIVRTVLHQHEFSEVETPILLKSSPEGAREFLVPTRIQTVSTSPQEAAEPLFYALPQSPQQPKQLLVASGAVDRYYQLARCFRDEDGRKDRQPEFTQIDLEMAWVSWGPPASVPSPVSGYSHDWRIGGTEVKDVIETLIRKIWHDIENIELPRVFPIMTYAEAMSRFGSDKPDIVDITELLSDEAQYELSQQGEVVEALVVSGQSPFKKASAAIPHDTLESGVEHLHQSSAGISSWVHSSASLRSLLSDLNEDGHMWVSRRPRTPEVRWLNSFRSSPSPPLCEGSGTGGFSPANTTTLPMGNRVPAVHKG
ncbi:hypothetical protein EUX98_g387 [Antrodiella citrinella]|uniref:Aminoacyl-transfer RNA synthetases class-II family profile domain-containing protein n=1 Tax=Antrodiella citrinella TaxID=2447956 RepID=A0A4S4N736_9APHY|nr:hypothetical protein EUX98_g387 [Antrodiella citrinella]